MTTLGLAIHVRRGRTGRLTGWCAWCEKCGIVDSEYVASKKAATRKANNHNTNHHKGIGFVQIPRGEQKK